LRISVMQKQRTWN